MVDKFVERTNEMWLDDLRQTGLAHDQALADLREFMLRGIMGYLRSRSDLNQRDHHDLDQLAQDTVQEALIKVQAKLDTFQGKSKFTTWATKIAINHLISELRRQHWRNISLQTVLDEGTTLEEVVQSGPGDAGNPSVSAERQQVWATIVQALENDLTARQREALVTTQLNGVPLAAAAKMLNTNTNNLYKLLHDARLKLKKAMIAQGLDPAYILDLFAQ